MNTVVAIVSISMDFPSDSATPSEGMRDDLASVKASLIFIYSISDEFKAYFHIFTHIS